MPWLPSLSYIVSISLRKCEVGVIKNHARMYCSSNLDGLIHFYLAICGHPEVGQLSSQTRKLCLYLKFRRYILKSPIREPMTVDQTQLLFESDHFIIFNCFLKLIFPTSRTTCSQMKKIKLHYYKDSLTSLQVQKIRQRCAEQCFHYYFSYSRGYPWLQSPFLFPTFALT